MGECTIQKDCLKNTLNQDISVLAYASSNGGNQFNIKIY